MATDELLPPACAFALSVLADRDLDPDSVPEEAVEAAEQHIATCVRCLSSPATTSSARKKKKARRIAESDFYQSSAPSTLVEEPAEPVIIQPPSPPPPLQRAAPVASERPAQPVALAPVISPALQALSSEAITCQQCRQVLKEYAEAMDNGQHVEDLYPAVFDHLQICESGCLVLLDLLRQEARANRKYRRRPVRDPFRAIGWEVTGFFRGGQITATPMAISYGTLILLLLVASLAAYLAVAWDNARYYHPPIIQHTIPTPDGFGLSDGLKIFDACNAISYQDKRAAAQDMQHGNTSAAQRLLTSAANAPVNDTTGCNGAEAAIYLADLQVRLSGHPFGLIMVSFDSGPGDANPQGGTNRHDLYAAATQELIGAYIAQQQYNAVQAQTPGAPLLYLVLANTTGTQQGALLVSTDAAALANAANPRTLGLQISNGHPLLALLGLGPSNLTQVALPQLCRAGIPLIAPTATGAYVADLIAQTSLYQQCAPGFAFVRFSPDITSQSMDAGSYAYRALHARNVAIFYDPTNVASGEASQAFSYAFTHAVRKERGERIVATETAIDQQQISVSQASPALQADLQAGLTDTLQAKPRPDLIFAALSTNDAIALAQAIAALPSDQQPTLIIGNEYIQPTALEGLVTWVRQQQLALPRVYALAATAASPSTDVVWQTQFYGSFCKSFAPPGSSCGGATALDQGALLFADGVELVARVIAPITDISKLPTTAQLVQEISQESFAGVSGPIKLSMGANQVVTNQQAAPVMLSIQSDGSIQIVG
jgi:hypothetical protein